MSKYKKLFAIGFAISIISTILVLLFTIDATTFIYLRKINPYFLILALIINMLSWVVWGFRIKILANSLDNNLKLINSIKIVIASSLVAALTPSNIGGEPVRLHFLHRNGLTIGDASVVTLGERLIDGLFIGLAAPIAFFLAKDIIEDELIRMFFMVAALMLLMLLCIFIYGLFHINHFKVFSSFFIRFIAKLIGKTNKIDYWTKLLNIIIDDFDKSIKKMLNNKASLFMTILCTIVYWILIFIIPSFILIGLGSSPMWVYSISAQIILTLIMIIPITPGGSGIAEISFISIYAAFVDSSILGVVAVVWRFVAFHSTIIISSIVSLKLLQEEELI